MNERPVDAFPNAPGLSRELGLIPYAGPRPGVEWYSICSGHSPKSQIDPNCPRCMVGTYGARAEGSSMTNEITEQEVEAFLALAEKATAGQMYGSKLADLAVTLAPLLARYWLEHHALDALETACTCTPSRDEALELAELQSQIAEMELQAEHDAEMGPSSWPIVTALREWLNKQGEMWDRQWQRYGDSEGNARSQQVIATELKLDALVAEYGMQADLEDGLVRAGWIHSPSRAARVGKAEDAMQFFLLHARPGLTLQELAEAYVQETEALS